MPYLQLRTVLGRNIPVAPNHIALFHDVFEAIDNEKQVYCLFLDFRKPFHSVCYVRLLGKIKYYGSQRPIIP